MTYRLSLGARADLVAAASYYDTRRAGLGSEFTVEVGLALAKVLEAPQRWPEIEDGVRRCQLSRFPYGLIYRVASAQLVEVIAIFDLRRRPGSWK